MTTTTHVAPPRGGQGAGPPAPASRAPRPGVGAGLNWTTAPTIQHLPEQPNGTLLHELRLRLQPAPQIPRDVRRFLTEMARSDESFRNRTTADLLLARYPRKR